jgi:hypothetical protein
MVEVRAVEREEKSARAADGQTATRLPLSGM